jgi:hypothetical protein
MSHPAENLRGYRLEELIYYRPLASDCKSKAVQLNTVAEGNICVSSFEISFKN